MLFKIKVLLATSEGVFLSRFLRPEPWRTVRMCAALTCSTGSTLLGFQKIGKNKLKSCTWTLTPPPSLCMLCTTLKMLNDPLNNSSSLSVLHCYFTLPVLQTHYRHLEAIALEHEEVEPFVDLTLPDHEMIGKRAGKLLDEYTSMVYSPGYNPDKPVTKRKVCCCVLCTHIHTCCHVHMSC